MRTTTTRGPSAQEPFSLIGQEPRRQLGWGWRTQALALGTVLIASLALSAHAAEADNSGSAPPCPVTFKTYTGTEPLTCACPSGVAVGNVWGTDIYTNDSAVCRAALHAGAITTEGGTVTIRPAPGQGSYIGTSRNGVASSNYGAWGASFAFEGTSGADTTAEPATCPANFSGYASTEPLKCFCPPGSPTGNVWGTDVYTNDSAICRAAIHAGAITTDGGAVTVHPAPGQASYTGTSRNGVTTGNYGSWGGSFRF